MGPFLDNWTSKQVDDVIAEGKVDDLLYVPIVISMNANEFGAARAEEICLSLAKHADEKVRANAIKGLGHLARVTGQFSCEDSIQCIRDAIADPSELVRSHAQDTLSDIYMFTGMRISE